MPDALDAPGVPGVPATRTPPEHMPGRYAVIGHPVRHSRSPAIHAAFAAQTGESIDYLAIECPHDGFAVALQRFFAEGGHGCNVTVPFKFDALAVAGRRTERAARAGAANTLRLDRPFGTNPGGAAPAIWADNTDGVGLVADLRGNAGVEPAGRRILLVGAGGAAAGLLGPLIEAAPAAIVVCNRTAERATALIDRHADLARRGGVSLIAAPIARPGEAFDLVLNATAGSLGGELPPIPSVAIGRGALAVDLMYGAAARAFLDWAERHGAVGRDGLGMLVEQAAESYFAWRGLRPATRPVLESLRRSVDAPEPRR